MTLPRIIVEEAVPEEVSREWVTPAEMALTRKFAPARRREAWAWRYIVRREVGRDADIRYNEVGAPYIANYPVYISVSHSKGRVAVAFSNRKCAVDIEQLRRHFGTVKDYYLNNTELQIAEIYPNYLAEAWSAKETVFKYMGRPELDFAEDIDLSIPRDGYFVVNVAGADDLVVAFEMHKDEGYVLTSIL